MSRRSQETRSKPGSTEDQKKVFLYHKTGEWVKFLDQYPDVCSYCGQLKFAKSMHYPTNKKQRCTYKEFDFRSPCPVCKETVNFNKDWINAFEHGPGMCANNFLSTPFEDRRNYFVVYENVEKDREHAQFDEYLESEWNKPLVLSSW